MFDIETFVVDAEKISDKTWIFTPKSGTNPTQDPWIFNFLGRSTEAGSEVTVEFCSGTKPPLTNPQTPAVTKPMTTTQKPIRTTQKSVPSAPEKGPCGLGMHHC